MRTFWQMAKARFLYGYPIFTGFALLLTGIFAGSAILASAITGNWSQLHFAVSHFFSLTVFIQIIAPLIIGFPLMLTLIFIMMGTTDFEED